MRRKLRNQDAVAKELMKKAEDMVKQMEAARIVAKDMVGPNFRMEVTVPGRRGNC